MSTASGGQIRLGFSPANPIPVAVVLRRLRARLGGLAPDPYWVAGETSNWRRHGCITCRLIDADAHLEVYVPRCLTDEIREVGDGVAVAVRGQLCVSPWGGLRFVATEVVSTDVEEQHGAEAENGRRKLETERLRSLARTLLKRERATLARARVHLQALSPRRILARGYAVPRNARGEVVRSATWVHRGGEVRLRFADGEVVAEVRAVKIYPARERVA